jgi:dihydropteroate synthase-like protein
LRTLIVTGLLAKDIVVRSLSENSSSFQICVLPVPVASLMSLEYITKMLETRDLSKIDLILIPGLIKGDTSKIEEKTHIKTWKGPRNAADLPNVLEVIDKVRFSTTLPADELVRVASSKRAERTLAAIERKAMHTALSKSLIPVGTGKRRIFVGTSLPMRVLAEIVDASSQPADEIEKIALRFEAYGVDIIDVGMVAGGGHPEDSVRAVKAVKKSTQKAVSIDASDPEEIMAAVKAGADLILSINAENMEEVGRFGVHIPVVVTSAGKNHQVPVDVEDRLKQLSLNVKRARSLGFRKIIADPVLNPLLMPSLSKSIFAYMRYRNTNPSTPMLFGAGNVTELIDADSVGANLLLAGLASEIGANIILTTEASTKTCGSAMEAVSAVRMIALAKARRTAPEDLGIDLLRMKEKHWREESFKICDDTRRLSAKNRPEFIHDPKGSFKISVDRLKRQIVLIHYSYGHIKPDLVIEGSSPERLIDVAIRNGRISHLEHAFYLGRELEKAKIALETGKCYVQDMPLLFGQE